MPCWLPDFARCQRCRCGMAHPPASRWRSCGGWRMSHGGELFASADITSRPGFELVRRGYDKPQVDQYVSQVGSMISRLAGERELALSQIQDMAAQLQRLQAEVTELRKRPVQVDRASFRHLGAMVDQILALAEKQAEAITSTAAQRAANRQAEAEKVLVEARERAAKTLADLEEQLAAPRAEAQQQLAELRTKLEQEIDERRAAAGQKIVALHAEAQQHATDVRRRADKEAAAHQQKLATVQEEIRGREQALAQLHTELDAAQQQLAQARQAQATAEDEVAQLQQRLGGARQDLTAELSRLEEVRRAADAAERHAKEVRARVQREAKRVADLAAAAVMAAAAGGADTGEYPMVSSRPRDDQTAANDNGRGRNDTDDPGPAQQGRPAGKVTADAE